MTCAKVSGHFTGNKEGKFDNFNPEQTDFINGIQFTFILAFRCSTSRMLLTQWLDLQRNLIFKRKHNRTTSYCFEVRALPAMNLIAINVYLAYEQSNFLLKSNLNEKQSRLETFYCIFVIYCSCVRSFKMLTNFNS